VLGAWGTVSVGYEGEKAEVTAMKLSQRTLHKVLSAKVRCLRINGKAVGSHGWFRGTGSPVGWAGERDSALWVDWHSVLKSPLLPRLARA
jgi:hypothetical protein